jgi:Recombination endonuclease VII
MPYKDPADRRAYFRTRYAEDVAFRDRMSRRSKANYAKRPKKIATRAQLDIRNDQAKGRRRADPEGYRATRREISRRTPVTKKKDWALRKRYGITFAEQQELIAKQRGLCPICRKPLRARPHTDHDHQTGAIRGIVHAGCNTAIGRLGDNADGVFSAYVYLTTLQPAMPLVDEHW